MSSTRVRLSIIASLLILVATAAPAAAQIWISSPNVPASIPDPTAGFTITYTMGGSQYGSATAQVAFYLSATKDGSSGVGLLTSYQVLLRGSGSGPYGAPFGTQSTYIWGPNLSASANAMLQSIRDACQPQNLYVLAQVNGGFFKYTPTVMGTVKLPDFTFTGGSISPSTIQPGGTTNLSFSLFSRCPASSASRVGIYLTDLGMNPLAFIGAVSISAGAGTWTMPPTPITFSPYLPPGNYRIVLVADLDGVVGESNESNNTGYFDLTVSLARTGDQPPGQLQPGAELRDDVGPELEDLERDPPGDYVTPIRAATRHARP